MRLGTKILLLTLAATVGLSLTVIYVVRREVTAHEIDRARRTIKWAVSGYFASVDERHQRDLRLVNVLMDPYFRGQLLALEEGDAESRRSAHAQLAEVFFPKTVQRDLTHAGIAPAFHVLINSRGEIRFANAADNATLAKSLAAEIWPHDAVLRDGPLIRRYVWINNALFLAMGIPIRTHLDEEPTHAYFVGYRVDDQWLSKLLNLVRQDASRREESLAIMSAWFLVDGNVVARAVSSDNSMANVPDRASAIAAAAGAGAGADK